ncbi:hypothetical protein FXO38_20394 [Capsicum annuum]|nr:hypothetical protein FXO38_20394 [Capsicum annuum]KAF3646956.1 hypothetical protein FXO37_20213 [Capsicum annuum]
MVLIDMVFHYDDIVNEYNGTLGFLGVQQVIVSFPSEKYYEIVYDLGIRTLLYYVNDKFDVINFFAIEDNELPIDVKNIVRLKESVVEVDEADSEDSGYKSNETDNNGCNASGYFDYDSKELENAMLLSYGLWNCFSSLKPQQGRRDHINLRYAKGEPPILYEISKGNDKHNINLQNKRCSYSLWELTGIPCPDAIKELLYKVGKRSTGVKAMKPPSLVTLDDRPATTRKRDKDEALKRKTKWLQQGEASQDSASTQRQLLFGESFDQSIFGPSPSYLEY